MNSTGKRPDFKIERDQTKFVQAPVVGFANLAYAHRRGAKGARVAFFFFPPLRVCFVVWVYHIDGSGTVPLAELLGVPEFALACDETVGFLVVFAGQHIVCARECRGMPPDAWSLRN